MENLKQLLDLIYNDIRQYNTEGGTGAIPLSNKFYDEIIAKYHLVPFGIPKLLKILVDSHKIFSFNIVEADRKTKVRRIEAFVVTNVPIIQKLKKSFEDEMVREYSHEFQKKLSPDVILKEFVPLLDKYNNTKLGIAANIVLNLRHFVVQIEKNIMKYGQSWQEKQIEFEIEKCDALSSFISQSAESKIDESSRGIIRNLDAEQVAEFKKTSSNYSKEKTLAIYGIEFYTRVCFRDYQFTLIQKLIEQDVIIDQEKLKIIKKLLQKERANADRDMKLQEYAQDINALEKVLNDRLKKD